MNRPRLATALAAIILLLAFDIFGHLYYSGPDAGVVFDVGGHCFGYEWRGEPGFLDSCG